MTESEFINAFDRMSEVDLGPGSLRYFQREESMQENGNNESKPQKNFDQWAILEVMGKTRLGGRVREEHVFGVPMVRIDIPNGEPGQFQMTRYFHPQALFSVTPVGEKEATAVAIRNTAPPVYRWEMPEQKQIAATSTANADDVIDPDYDPDDEDDGPPY